MKNRIDSLQALRTLAFIGIFLSHADFRIAWSNLGVSIFFVLSGFLMAHNYKNRNITSSLTNNLCFALKKIKKYYILHILTMLLMIMLSVDYIIRSDSGIRAVRILVLQIVCNISLTQTWVPYRNFPWSLNGVAWYLSAILFLYFCFPWIKEKTEKKSTLGLCFFCLLIILSQIIGCMLFNIKLDKGSVIYIWFMKFFPVFRLGDFFAGCTLSHVYDYMRSHLYDKKLFISMLEIFATICTIAVYCWSRYDYKNLLFIAYNNKTTPYIFVAALWVLLFALNEGVITKILTNRISIYIGNLSSYLFLIHYVVIEYVKRFLPKTIIVELGDTLIILIEFAISIILSELYRQVHEKHLLVARLHGEHCDGGWFKKIKK